MTNNDLLHLMGYITGFFLAAITFLIAAVIQLLRRTHRRHYQPHSRLELYQWILILQGKIKELREKLGLKEEEDEIC